MTLLIPFQKRERLICIEQLFLRFVGDEKPKPGSLWSASQNLKFQDCLALIAEALRDSAGRIFRPLSANAGSDESGSPEERP
jgi:hypothetical protein